MNRFPNTTFIWWLMKPNKCILIHWYRKKECRILASLYNNENTLFGFTFILFLIKLSDGNGLMTNAFRNFMVHKALPSQSIIVAINEALFNIQESRSYKVVHRTVHNFRGETYYYYYLFLRTCSRERLRRNPTSCGRRVRRLLFTRSSQRELRRHTSGGIW